MRTYPGRPLLTEEGAPCHSFCKIIHAGNPTCSPWARLSMLFQTKILLNRESMEKRTMLNTGSEGMRISDHSSSSSRYSLGRMKRTFTPRGGFFLSKKSSSPVTSISDLVKSTEYSVSRSESSRIVYL